MIIILFGLSGSGKTYIGNILAKYFDFFHFDADQLLTDEMNKYIAENKIFNIDMLEILTQLIINKISHLKEIYPRLVISQGLYRNKNRQTIERYFVNNNIIFAQITATDEIISKRLRLRKNKVTCDYANNIKQNFEPMKKSIIINNHYHHNTSALIATLRQQIFKTNTTT